MEITRGFRSFVAGTLACALIVVISIVVQTAVTGAATAYADDRAYQFGRWERRGPVLIGPNGRVFLRIPLPPPPGYFYRKMWREHEREIAELERIANDDDF